MAQTWDEARVQQYIDDGTEESLTLDYKAAGALGKTDGKKREITKDVSAMANSDGGIIIYGLTEDPTDKHLPGKIDPVNRRDFSKEWLEQVIGNIRPKIERLLIYPVPIGNSNTDVVYVVDITKSHTAHQAMDKRYYKRFNFQSVMMDDYEIRDVMNRLLHPLIELGIEIIAVQDEKGVKRKLEARVKIRNTGTVLARYVEARIAIPTAIVYGGGSGIHRSSNRSTDPDERTVFRRYNRERFAVGNSGPPAYASYYGTPLYVPLFPGLEMPVESIDLGAMAVFRDENKKYIIKWTAFADSAAPKSGEVVAYDKLRLG